MSNDLIRRSDAIKALRKRWARTVSYNGIGEDIGEECVEELEAVPSADRPQGEWIKPYGDSRFMCSICKGKENVPTCMGKPSVWDYCPNCGAYMKGADDETDRR